MSNIKISVINASTVLTDVQISAAVTSLQIQVHRDFAPIWGIDADLSFVPKNATPDPKTWWLAIMDNTDTQGVLGYHDVTTAGLPLGKVFARTDMIYGSSWTITTSHELLEMIADPEIDLTVFNQTSNFGGRLYAYEVCDPCEADSQGYLINNIPVSDFVTPMYFMNTARPNSRLDFKNLIRRPFQILPGGYQAVFDIRSGTGWKIITADGSPSFISRPHKGSRRERRFTPRDMWQTSTIKFNSSPAF
jgi:hypothetical protein